ncbi:alpha-amylase family protein [uncultured Sphaerochaeta sp.]|uniref:alpha-amylase family protein n=1 Tax=uncultured Sphaerochaeta sp. TaxID=886478 RepID=UPI002AA61244|nr:alpha-amylase family protein [uncultured Sphaerochaeta sp.]
MYSIPFRHIHLDFHTSGLIEGIGKDFSKDQFKQALRAAHVDSITLCAKCHHGWMYYPSNKFPMHPHLSFDLFGEMLSAAKELGISVEAYLSVGYDEVIALAQNQYLMRKQDQKLDSTTDFFTPGYHQFCMNTPYLGRICDQIEEVLSRYQVDGIFLDIVGVRTCYCASCMQTAQEQGIDPSDASKMQSIWEHTYIHYIEQVKKTVERVQPGIEIFHNSGHINRGRLDLMHVNSHLELESLPSGGWGYDHFLLSSRFVQHFGKPYLGMTGRFQFGWGDFGGYKHPNGMRYEVSRFLANGAGCSIGDQMHPFGKLEDGLYSIIGTIYQEVEAKQPWCTDVTAVTEIGVLSTESAGNYHIDGVNASLLQGSSDIGAVRILQEGHLLFDILSASDSFTPYKVIILPDRIALSEELENRLDTYLQNGGKILATGISGIKENGKLSKRFGVYWKGQNQSIPNYIEPCSPVTSLSSDSFVMYQGSQEIEILEGDSSTILGFIQESFFNRSVEHFSSHYHTASSLDRKGPGMVQNEQTIYAVWNFFSEYALKGNLAAKYLVLESLKKLLERPIISTSYPSQVELSIMEQKGLSRYVVHILHGSKVVRGKNMEVVEDHLPVPASDIEIRVEQPIHSVYLVPTGEKIPFTFVNGSVRFTVPSFTCHQMICLCYGENNNED